MTGTYGTPLFWRGPYAMRVASSVSQADSEGAPRNQWLYTLEPVDWGDDYFYVDALVTDTDWLNCINMWEINNTPTVAMGLPVDSNSVLQPAPDGAIVMAYILPSAEDTNGIKPLVVFQWPNQWECA